MANAYLSPAEKARADAQNLAAEILAGKYDAIEGPYGRSGVYSLREWREAAQYLVDTDDCDDVLFMLAQEIASDGEWSASDDDTFWRDSSYAISRGMGEGE